MPHGWQLVAGAAILGYGWYFAIRWLDNRYQPKRDEDMVKHLRERDEWTGE